MGWDLAERSGRPPPGNQGECPRDEQRETEDHVDDARDEQDSPGDVGAVARDLAQDEVTGPLEDKGEHEPAERQQDERAGNGEDALPLA